MKVNEEKIVDVVGKAMGGEVGEVGEVAEIHAGEVRGNYGRGSRESKCK